MTRQLCEQGGSGFCSFLLCCSCWEMIIRLVATVILDRALYQSDLKTIRKPNSGFSNSQALLDQHTKRNISNHVKVHGGVLWKKIVSEIVYIIVWIHLGFWKIWRMKSRTFYRLLAALFFNESVSFSVKVSKFSFIKPFKFKGTGLFKILFFWTPYFRITPRRVNQYYILLLLYDS